LSFTCLGLLAPILLPFALSVALLSTVAVESPDSLALLVLASFTGQSSRETLLPSDSWLSFCEKDELLCFSADKELSSFSLFSFFSVSTEFCVISSSFV
jgi:hypothetical protein